MNSLSKVFSFEYENNVGLVNLTPGFFALYIKSIFSSVNKNILIVTPSLYEASNVVNSFLGDDRCLLFESDDIITSNIVASSPDILVNRLSVLNEIVNKQKRIVVTDLNGYLGFLPDKKNYESSFVNLSVNMQIDLKELSSTLIDLGYSRNSIVSKTGDIGVRGFVLDIFPIGFINPVRLEFFGDTIESIRYFDIDTQKSLESVENITIMPFSLSFSPTYSSLFDYLDNPIVVFKDYSQLNVVYDRMVNDAYTYFNSDIKCFFELHEIVPSEVLYYFDLDNDISNINVSSVFSFDVSSVDMFNENMNNINDYLKKQLDKGLTPILFLPTVDISKFLSFITSSYVITNVDNIILGSINIINCNFYRGFKYKDFVFLTEYELFNRKTVVRGKKNNFRYSTKIKDLSKIEIGDFVVHNIHGIGIYNGLKTLCKNDISTDYIEVLYDKGDKLYIPVSKIDLLSKFSAKEGYVPQINSLGSSKWFKTKQRVRDKIKYEAERLIRVQAMREAQEGFRFSPDSPMQELFESKFIYDDTPDQVKATIEIKKDMESNKPMDRILCGDVGYGKTEVAFRACFKAVMDSKQVLYVCPTTLLSKQQYEAAILRFRDFPVNIRLLNRFTSNKETKEILKELEEGRVDIVIGTHRLLSDDIRPCNLGLLIIDEEQRFGVAHKEKIKEFKANVDVLTLTATPIPRTLQMAMLGIKSLSLIETPPKNRYPVQTYVAPYDKKVIKDIIYREISRDGQVFVLYNLVSDIDIVKKEIETLVPDARVVVAHGKMTKGELEGKIDSFLNQEYNVLLCTTIIETGIDIPNANSLIVLNADCFGLSQLYQIRGRVGRSDRVAYAYLMYNKAKVLTESAVKRLNVIKEFTELGSGFHIAARDLSIRGAGDILGSEQAGFINVVGIDLYMKMLDEEIMKLKGKSAILEDDNDSTDSALVRVDTHIRDSYVKDEELKITIHKLINTIDSKEKLNEVKKELEDRFGKLDDNMFVYMNEELFEKLTRKVGVIKVLDNNNYIELEFSKEKSKEINYEELFIKSIKIINCFKFSYKNERLYIRVNKKDVEKHPILYLNELLEKIY